MSRKKLRAQMVLNELTRRRQFPRGSQQRRGAASLLKRYRRRAHRSAAAALAAISRAKVG